MEILHLLNPPLSLLLTDKSSDGIPTKLKWEIQALSTLYFKFWRYFLSALWDAAPVLFLSYCFTLVFTSADIVFQNFLEIHSTLAISKKIFVTNFPLQWIHSNPKIKQPKSAKCGTSFSLILPYGNWGILEGNLEKPAPNIPIHGLGGYTKSNPKSATPHSISDETLFKCKGDLIVSSYCIL